MYRARPLHVANHGKTDLSVHDCIRLALENSLDLQTASWDEQIKGKLAKSSLLRMLPTLKANYVLSTRDRPLWSRSDVFDQEGNFEVIGPGPGTGVTNFSTGRERFSRTANVQVEWSPMDALMARYLSEMRGNEYAHSGFQRVRVAQQLLSTVTAAFYRIVALNEAVPKVEALDRHRRNIVRDLESLVKSSLVDSQEYITARSLAAEAAQQLAEIHLNIGKQRELLAVAMNVCPDSFFRLIGTLIPLPASSLDPCQLETAALENRPEAYQADITLLNSVAEQKRLCVKYFPRVEGFLGYFRDENKFVLNRNWIDGGMKVTWDLLEFTANVLEHGASRDRVEKTDRERAVISLGILTQVRLKSLDAMKAFERLRKTDELEAGAREALRIAREVETVKDKSAPEKVIRIAREKALCVLLQAEIDRILALGDVHAAVADLDGTVGTNYPITQGQPVPTGPYLKAVAKQPFGLLRRAARFVGEKVMPK